MSINIKRFCPFYRCGELTTTVASFDVSIGDITFRKASLRYSNETLIYSVGLPGPSRGVALADPSPTRDALLDAVLARYRAYQDALTTDGRG
jgi:hypothetical protein